MINKSMKLTESIQIILLSESFKNLIGPASKDEREQYADQTWDILQSSYKKIGGIKGSGFMNKQDMIDNILFWKIFVRGGKVIAAALYKDKSGRKGVAYATDGSADGVKVLAGIFKQDIGRSYEELSGPALVLMMKQHDPQAVRPYLMTPKEVEKILKKPIGKVVVDDLNPEDKRLYDRFEDFKEYFYIRELDGHPHMKLSIGTPNLKIT